MIWQPGLMLVALVVMLAYIARPTRSASGNKIKSPVRWKTASGTTTIATYNICGGRGLDGIRDIDRAADVLAPFDIVGVQELFAADWRGNPSHLEQIARSNDSGWLFAPTRSRWFREYRGNGLLSRFPVDKWYREPLIDQSGHSYRNLLTARVRIGDDHLSVLVTHLHTREGRDLQLRRVMERFMEYSPAVLLGDLNTKRDDPLLANILSDPTVTDAIGLVLGERDPPDRVDWILTRGVTISEGDMIEVGVSDHPCFHISINFAKNS
jgi:endonuclease/exonuclease/phosphatase family metal-dependent hydrolase